MSDLKVSYVVISEGATAHESAVERLLITSLRKAGVLGVVAIGPEPPFDVTYATDSAEAKHPGARVLFAWGSS